MDNLQHAARNWRGISDEWLRFSHASVALQLAVGIDLDAALEAPWEARRLILPRVQRALRREHLRGVARHWSYDLNRHIALKQALAYLSDKTAVSEKKTAALSAAVFADYTCFRKLGRAGFPICPSDPSASGQGPSSWQAANVRSRSSVRPSDKTGQDPTSRDTGQASARNASSGGA